MKRSNPIDDFETGRPVRFRYMHNTESAPYLGARYGQDIEPHGTYLLEDEAEGWKHPLPGWEYGWVEFRNPLVLSFTLEPDEDHYGPHGWKQRLVDEYGKKGKALTKALRRDGYDGVVTYWDQPGHGPSYTKEIVDLTFGEAMEVDAVENPGDAEDYLYHVTFAGNLEGIQSDGLLPGSGGKFGGGYAAHSAGWLFITEPEGVYFWFHRIAATVTPLERAGETPVVLRFEPTDDEEQGKQEDKLGTRDAMAGAYILDEGIEPDRLEVWTGDDWEYLDELDIEELIGDIVMSSEVEEEDGEEWREYEDDLLFPEELHP
jgi:hypothetical protein